MAGDTLWAKYGCDQDLDLYGGRIAGRSGDGFPVQGAGAAFLTQREFDALPLYNEFKARWFKLWDPADLASFLKVMDHVYNGEFFVKRRLDVPVADFPKDEPGGGLKVWLEWTQVKARAPAVDAVQTYVAQEPGVNIPLFGG
jgi:hypothetical protein